MGAWATLSRLASKDSTQNRVKDLTEHHNPNAQAVIAPTQIVAQ